GLGTYSSGGNTLARTTILKSSNANAAVSWSAGTKTIRMVVPAEYFLGNPAYAFLFPLSRTTYPCGFLSGTTTNASGTDVDILTPILATVAVGPKALSAHDAESNGVAIGNYALAAMTGIEGYYQTGNFAAQGNGFHNVAIGTYSMGTSTAA